MEYTERNSKDFIEPLNETVVQEDEVMVSFDVQALYTNKLIDRALLAVRDKLESDVGVKRWDYQSCRLWSC